MLSKSKIIILIVTILIMSVMYQTIISASSDFSLQLQEKLKGAIILYIGKNKAYVNNVETRVDKDNISVCPVIKDGRTLVPVRFISESLGAKVLWDNQTSTAIVVLNGKTIKLTIGNKNMIVNDSNVQLDVPAQIINERTFIPLRALVEALGEKVFWDDRGLIIISDKENIIDSLNEAKLLNEIISKFYISVGDVSYTENRRIAVKGEWVYYVNMKEGNHLYRLSCDGKVSYKLTEDEAREFFIYEDLIYYDSYYGGISKIKLDGSDKTNFQVPAGDIIVAKNWIYYIDNNDGGIYKIKTDGSEKTLIEQDDTNCLTIKDEWIYYAERITEKNHGGIYKIKIDGTGKSKLDNLSSNSITVDGDWIYYGGDATNRIKIDGTNKQRITSNIGWSNCIVNGWIYYNNGQDNNRIYKININDRVNIKVNEDFTWDFVVSGNWIYYRNNRDKSVYKVKIDGKEKIKLSDRESERIIDTENTQSNTFFDQSQIINIDDGKQLFNDGKVNFEYPKDFEFKSGNLYSNMAMNNGIIIAFYYSDKVIFEESNFKIHPDMTLEDIKKTLIYNGTNNIGYHSNCIVINNNGDNPRYMLIGSITNGEVPIVEIIIPSGGQQQLSKLIMEQIANSFKVIGKSDISQNKVFNDGTVTFEYPEEFEFKKGSIYSIYADNEEIEIAFYYSDNVYYEKDGFAYRLYDNLYGATLEGIKSKFLDKGVENIRSYNDCIVLSSEKMAPIYELIGTPINGKAPSIEILLKDEQAEQYAYRLIEQIANSFKVLD